MKNILILLTIILLVGCQADDVIFDGESAFRLLEEQCEFGPRNPGSDGYNNCKTYLIDKLQVSADSVFTQNFELTELQYNITYKLSNIVAQYRATSDKHILLGAHWDTRPWADQDINIENRKKPIIGANDGASGVAVLLELAKIFKDSPPPVNITIVLFDGEDLGNEGNPTSYAKGSQYFAENLPIDIPDYGIIIDMIGDKFLEIPIERNSYRVAPNLMSELWDLAEKLKLSAFQNRLGYDVYDDHIPLWEIAQIPTIDLIDLNYPNQRINYWHTMNDTPQNCSEESLAQVGTLLTAHIYSREP